MLLDRYRDKVKSVEALSAVIGARPRERKVIMCHGVFDLVHPGHIRHLLYCKSKADILVVSVTADEHIKKGIYRPHIPGELRALNLAALEVVDYVIVDADASPARNITALQPDYYAKGFEYDQGNKKKGEIAEVPLVEAYGGEVIFTPGDIVYSSTKLLEAEPPNLRSDKLRLLIEQSGVTMGDLFRTLDLLAYQSVLVVGDTIVDSYTRCAMIGGQTKTPTMSVLYERRDDFVGGAAIVAKHLRATGAKVLFTTVIGDDKMGQFVIDDLMAADVAVEYAIEEARPTTHKNAIVVGDYRLLKVDTLDNRSISDKSMNAIAELVEGFDVGALIYADFRHGMFNARTMPQLLEAQFRARQRGVFCVADSQVASRWGNIADFFGFDLITPNEREARFSLGDQDSGVRPLASNLFKSADCGLLMMKLGARGVLTVTKDQFFTVDSFADHVVDAVGAGDAYLAYATLSMLALKNPVVATILGTMAAAVECEADGNVPVTVDEVREKLRKVKEELVL